MKEFDDLFRIAESYQDRLESDLDGMGCDAGNFDGGSASSCEHCQLKAELDRVRAALDKHGWRYCINTELEYERKKIAFCQEALGRIRDMAPPHSAIFAHIDVLLAFLRRTA